MSLYREAGGRRPATLVSLLLAGVAIGLLVGFLIGRASVGQPSVAEIAADARAGLRPVAAGLELVPIEYEGALDGGRVVAPTEYEATRGAASRAAEGLAAASEDLGAIDPAGYAAAERAVRRLLGAVDSVAPPARVDALARTARSRIAALAGPEARGARP